MYLSILNSFRVIRCLSQCVSPKIAIFTTFSPGDAPEAITLMLYGWKENSMLTNCLAACAHLTITVSEIQQDIVKKIVILSYPLAFDAPVRGFPSDYRHPLWYEKTRMVSLPDGEKISKTCLFVLTWSTKVTDGRTDRRTLRDSKDRAYASHRAVKIRWGMRPVGELTESVPETHTHTQVNLYYVHV